MDPEAIRVALDQTLSDRYRIEHELGVGGMARVYSARDPKHDRRVAIKILKPEIAALFGAERFLREINLTAGLQHPHILPLLDSGTVVVQGVPVPYYVMPLVAGLSLRVRLDLEGRIPVPEAAAIAGDVAQALGFAHERGIVHRDVKPENLLLSEAGPVLVADFGVARPLSDPDGPSLTEEGTSVGTPLYMSPEQAFGEGDIGPASDQYSLATVVFELLTGQAPYYAPTKEAILARRLVEPLPSLAATAPELATLDPVLQRALARRPEDRFPSMAEFARALDQALGGRWTGAAASTPKGSRRLRNLGLGVGVLVAVAVGVRFVVRKPAAAKSRALPIVAVLPFENLTTDSSLAQVGRITADWIVQGVSETGIARIINSELTLRGEAQDEARGTQPSGRAQRVGRIVGATMVVAGRYQTVGDSLEFSIQVMDATTGELLRAVRPFRVGRADLSAAANVVRERALGAVAFTIQGTTNPLVRLVSATPNFAAYTEYANALELQRVGKDADATKLLLRAYQLDSAFIPPILTAIGNRFGNGQIAWADSMLKTLESRVATLSPMEQSTIRAMRALTKGDALTAANALRSVDSLAPSDDNKYGIAEVEMSGNRIHAAAELLDQCNSDDGLLMNDETFWMLWATVRHRLGRFAEALEVAKKGRRALPASALVRQAEITQLIALGRLDEADSALALLRALPTSDLAQAGMIWAVMAAELRTHGYRDRARSVADRGLTWLHDVAGAKGTTLSSGAELLLDMELERWPAVIAIADSLRKVRPQDLLYVGSYSIGMLKTGRPIEADSAMAAALRGQYGNPGEKEFTMARVTAAKGRPAEAVQWLQRALASGYNAANISLHVDQQFDAIRGRSDFQATVQPQG